MSICSSPCKLLDLRELIAPITTPRMVLKWLTSPCRANPMASPAQSRPQYQFGVYTVDLQACELRKLGSRIVLQERPFQLLLALIERPGEVVTREEFLQQLWPDGTFVVFDDIIVSAIITTGY